MGVNGKEKNVTAADRECRVTIQDERQVTLFMEENKEMNEMITQNTETFSEDTGKNENETVTAEAGTVAAESTEFGTTPEMQQTQQMAETSEMQQTPEQFETAPEMQQTPEHQGQVQQMPGNMYGQVGGAAAPNTGWEPIGPDPFHSYKQGGIPLYGYRDSVYGSYYGQGGQGAHSAMPPYMNPEPVQKQEPVKKKHEARKKHPVLFRVIDAVVFGVIAALVFLGCNYLYGYFFPKEAEEYSIVQVAKETGPTADAVKTTDSVETVLTTTTDVSTIVEKVAPAIVQIDCMFNSNSYFGSYQTPGAGSGIVLRKTDKEILIATNDHVVEKAVSIKITFTDGTTADAVIKGTDSVADLAVVSVDISKLDKTFVDNVTVAKLGSSDDVRVGQMAIAIGNSMGYGQSTTVGYISAKDRTVKVDGVDMILIQTDAAINPGNSGGALINVSGEVIGINSVKFASSQVEGMGFAIPISRAQKILDELGNRESLAPEEKGYLGVHVQSVTSAIAQAYNWPVGVYVTEVDEGLAAEAAGVEIGDIIVRVNGVTVTTTTDLKTAISSYRAGTKITVTVMRLVDNAFEEIDIDAVLGNEPVEEEPAEDAGKDEAAADGENKEEQKESEEDKNAPKASPKDGMPEKLPEGNESNGDGSVEIPDYFDPFKDFEDMFPFGQW